MNIIKKMILLFWLPPSMYQQVYFIIALIFVVYYAFRYSKMSDKCIKKGDLNSAMYTSVLAVVLILFFGLRPINAVFGDMVIYLRNFMARCQAVPIFDYSQTDGEVGWAFLSDLSRFILPGQSVLSQFELLSFIVASGYIGFLAWGCIRIDRKHSFVLFITSVSVFTFYSYAVNGMRNGLACSIIILAISYMTPKPLDKIKAVILCLIASKIHSSTLLPAVAMFLSYYFIDNTKWCIYFWLISILISFTVGGAVENILLGLGFDDRMATYLSGDYIKTDLIGRNITVKVGFRWDFLLYSFLPIAIGWLATKANTIRDKKYMVLLNTYIISNAFWVMVIRASQSNRFAYLSWFIYGIVMIYPLLNFKIFNQQGGVIAVLLMVQIAFTFIMM